MRDLLERTVEEVLGFWPGAAEVFRRVGLGNCLGCAMGRFETLGEAFAEYRVDPEQALAELASAAEGKSWRPKRS